MTQAAKVHTRHTPSNDAIEKLREAAAAIQATGDELVRAYDELADARSELVGAKDELADLTARLEGARAAVDDHRLGLCDTEELHQRVLRA